jgi:hypothetical protein
VCTALVFWPTFDKLSYEFTHEVKPLCTALVFWPPFDKLSYEFTIKVAVVELWRALRWGSGQPSTNYHMNLQSK